MIIKIKKLVPEAQLPQKATEDSIGMDLIATRMESKNGFIEFGFGQAWEIPIGYGGFIFPRSSISNQPLILSNCVGVIDPDYRGEIMARFKRIANTPNLTYDIGKAIAQVIILQIPEVSFREASELNLTERGNGGYGHTDITKTK